MICPLFQCAELIRGNTSKNANTVCEGERCMWHTFCSKKQQLPMMTPAEYLREFRITCDSNVKPS